MKSLDRTSDISERTCREICAVRIKPNVAAGRITWEMKPVALSLGATKPPAGNSPVAGPARNSRSNVAVTNSGIDAPIYENIPITRSRCVPRFNAASTPSGIATTVTAISAVAARAAEFQKASPTTSDTGSDRRSDWPKSHRSTPPSQSAYCTYQGWSRPRRRSSAATASSVPYSPRIMMAAFPGRIIVMAKTAKVTTNRTRITARKRRVR